jgi:hypothetical protein
VGAFPCFSEAHEERVFAKNLWMGLKQFDAVSFNAPLGKHCGLMIRRFGKQFSRGKREKLKYLPLPRRSSPHKKKEAKLRGALSAWG